MKPLALTGGIACGKTTAGHFLLEAGFSHIYDTDAVCHDLYDDPTPELLAGMREKWGDDRDHIITVDAGSFYGILRNWMGVENASYALYDEPEWVQEVMDYLADFYIAVLQKAERDFKIDTALFWEDICYKNGPLISPDKFRELCAKHYKK